MRKWKHIQHGLAGRITCKKESIQVLFCTPISSKRVNMRTGRPVTGNSLRARSLCETRSTTLLHLRTKGRYWLPTLCGDLNTNQCDDNWNLRADRQWRSRPNRKPRKSRDQGWPETLANVAIEDQDSIKARATVVAENEDSTETREGGITDNQNRNETRARGKKSGWSCGRVQYSIAMAVTVYQESFETWARMITDGQDFAETYANTIAGDHDAQKLDGRQSL